MTGHQTFFLFFTQFNCLMSVFVINIYVVVPPLRRTLSLLSERSLHTVPNGTLNGLACNRTHVRLTSQSLIQGENAGQQSLAGRLVHL